MLTHSSSSVSVTVCLTTVEDRHLCTIISHQHRNSASIPALLVHVHIPLGMSSEKNGSPVEHLLAVHDRLVRMTRLGLKLVAVP